MVYGRTDPKARGKLIAAIKITQKQLQMDDPTYRDFLARNFSGLTSCTQLEQDQLAELLDALKRELPEGHPARTKGHYIRPEHRKARALWFSLFHLGVVETGSDAAFAAYVRGMTEIDNPRFVRNWTPIIEGLKAWAAREGGVDWSERWDSLGDPRSQVILAQWKRLVDAGVIKNRHAMMKYARSTKHVSRECMVWQMDLAQRDRFIEHLGGRIRKLGERPAASAS